MSLLLTSYNFKIKIPARYSNKNTIETRTKYESLTRNIFIIVGGSYLYSCRDKFLTYFSGGVSLSWFWKLTLLAVVWDTWVAGIVNST